LIEVIVNGCPSRSLSFPRRFKTTGIFAGVDPVLSRATGGVLITVIVMIAFAVPPFPSEISYGKFTTPTKPVLGTNVSNPVIEEIIFPPVTGIVCMVPDTIVIPLIFVIMSKCPSGSLSLSNGLITRGVFARVEPLSLTAIGGVLVIVIISSAVAVPPAPSEIV
jgi:hypothetical protein